MGKSMKQERRELPRQKTKEEIQREWDAMTKACRGCAYFAPGRYCDYLTMVGSRRPCKPGKACTVRKQIDRRKRVNYDKMKALHEIGKTDEEISEIVSCGISTVAKWRQMNKLPPNRRPEKEESQKAKEKKSPRVDYEKIREFYDKGLTDREIVAAVGCGISTVEKWRYKNGLRINAGKVRGKTG